MRGLSDLGHFMKNDFLDRSLGDLFEDLQVIAVHVDLPEVARFPVFKKEEVGRIRSDPAARATRNTRRHRE